MSVERKDVWEIESWRIVTQRVAFDFPVTSAEAEELWRDDDYADILDENIGFIMQVEWIK